jgi:hypothetical protein
VKNALIQLKVKQRLNKLASNDYDNFEAWMIEEAFNKAQIEWVRRQITGTNARREGDEASVRRIDDLQILLKEITLSGIMRDQYFETVKIPTDFLEYKRVTGIAQPDNCEKPIKIKVYLGEEANVGDYLRDSNTKPSLEWAETFCTMFQNQIRIYGGRELSLKSATLSYFRQPTPIQIAFAINLNTGNESPVDVDCEFKDDIVEILIDETAAILAADIENVLQMQRNKQNADLNN